MKKFFSFSLLFFASNMFAGAQGVSATQVTATTLQQPSLSQQIAGSTFQTVYTPTAGKNIIVMEKAKLPFFCRQEAKIEEKTKLPLRIRVGSLEQSNFLEQKTDYVNKGF